MRSISFTMIIILLISLFVLISVINYVLFVYLPYERGEKSLLNSSKESINVTLSKTECYRLNFLEITTNVSNKLNDTFSNNCLHINVQCIEIHIESNIPKYLCNGICETSTSIYECNEIKYNCLNGNIEIDTSKCIIK